MASKPVIIKPPNQLQHRPPPPLQFRAPARAPARAPVRVPPPLPARVPTPLVYNDSIDTTNMTNIMLIDSNVLNNNEFYDSANANTFPIIYNYNSSTEDLNSVLRKKFSASSIQRISLVFHDKGTCCMVPFMNNKLLFDTDDLIENQTSFTLNVSFLISCIKEFRVANIDFLACNTLQYSNWKSYYALLASHTSVVVGASNDATGNVQYGGDWVMESTGQDIKQIYFSNNIDYYKYLLADYTLNGIQYTFTSATTASVSGFDLSITIANIPSTITPGSTYDVTSIGNSAFFNCNTLLSVTIPNSVTSIAQYAFYSCTQISSVTIPDSVTSIDSYAFYGCILLASVTLPTNASFTNIGLSTFTNCSSLLSITIPNSVTSISPSAFTNCSSLNSVTLPTNALFTSIGQSVFQQCSSLNVITIPNSVTSIGQNAFSSCGLNNITIPNSVTSIGESAFSSCSSLNPVTLPTNALFTTIAPNVFSGCSSLTSVVIPNSVTSIGFGAFESCSSLNSLTLPTNALFTSIGGYVFSSCQSLTYVFIPDSVTSIGSNAFGGCIILSAVYFLQTSTLPTIVGDAFAYIATPNVGKYYSSVSNSSIIAPLFTTISPISSTPPTLTSMTPFNSSTIFYSDLVINGNEVVSNPPFGFLVTSITSGSLAISGNPWNASTNNIINQNSPTASWTAPVGSVGLLNAFMVVVKDVFGAVSTPNVQVQVNVPVNLVVDGSTNAIYLRMSGSVIQYSIGTSTSPSSWTSIPSGAWPVQIVNSNLSSILRVAATQNLSISDTYANTSGYFDTRSDNITFDGSGNTITMNTITSYPGFIKNYNDATSTSYSNIVVKNFTTDAIGGSTLIAFGGWLCQELFGVASSGNQIINCTNRGNFAVATIDNCGGIVGAYAGQGGSVTFTNCSNSGTISDAGGGIAGAVAGAYGGSVTFTNCSNSGEIGGGGGGIVGSYSAEQGSVTFTNCSNSGTIIGGGVFGGGGIAGTGVAGGITGSATFTNCSNSGTISGGGIAGGDASRGGGLVTFTNCSNSGTIVGEGSGGIFNGYLPFSVTGVVIITNCINTGAISGGKSGGILGASSTFYGTSSDSNITLIRCINTGQIGGSGSGGIAGSNFACNTTYTCSIINCYSIGNITGAWCGGITGSGIGYTDDVVYLPKIVDISNCYSLGNIGPSCGGICGGRSSGTGYVGTPTINITNCYSYGLVTNAGSGIVSTGLPIPTNQNNIYVANGNWRDASANAIGALIGTPISLTTGNPGATWTKMANNYPYVLSAFNAQLYSPNNASSASNYTTSAGLFVDPSYNYQIINNNQSGNVASTLVFVAKGSIPYYYSYNTNTFQFTNSGTSTDIIIASITPSNGILNYQLIPICFKKGTKILCENDMYVPVEHLKTGDLVKTYKHGYRKVIMSAHSSLCNYSKNTLNQLYSYSREKNPDLIEDLHLTGGHSLLLDTLTDEESTLMNEINWPEDDFMVEEKYKLLACFSSQLYVAKDQNVDIYHFTLEPPENAKSSYVYGIYANGILAESCSQGAMDTISGKRIMIC